MQEAIGQSLVFAVGIAIVPIPIIAVILMLVTPRARINGPLFIVGWLIGLALVGVLVLAVAGPTDASTDDGPATWVSVLLLVLGLGLILLGVKQWRSRPREGEEPATPKWMGAVEGFGPMKALLAGIVLMALNPKNLVLALGAAAGIVTSGLSTTDEAIVYTVFALVATIGVATPVVIYFALGSRAGPILDGIKAWMAHNNAVIMAVLCLVIGAKLIGDGIAGL
jgi:threonine/homoserine/homoserine lactone efflux protein